MAPLRRFLRALRLVEADQPRGSDRDEKPDKRVAARRWLRATVGSACRYILDGVCILGQSYTVNNGELIR